MGFKYFGLKNLQLCHGLKYTRGLNMCFSSSQQGKDSYKLVIVGGGTGGIAMAAKFSRLLGDGHVAVIEPSEMHYYQPSWTLVGGGLKSIETSGRPTASIMPKKVKWIKYKATSFDPKNNIVCVENGAQIKYDYLIVAMGIELGFGKIKGLLEALETPGVCSNYSRNTVTKTVEAVKNFKEGNAIFTQPLNPIKCAGAPQKIMYLTDENFRKAGKREKANIIFNTALGTIFSAPKYAAALREVAKYKGITVNLMHNLIEVKPDTKEAIFETLDPKRPQSTVIYEYEMLHVTPPMTAPKILSKSPLADPAGFLDVDKYTLQHIKYSNVFGIGDCTNVPTSKTAAAIAGQCGILMQNLKAAMEEKQLPKKYNGYTSCPLLTGNRKAILAEFDFNLEPLETLPINQAKERWIHYFLKKDVMPFIYWNMMLRGHWEGPSVVRKIFHLGMSK